MKAKKNPHRGNRAGCNHCGGDDNSPTKKTEIPQPESAIHIKQDGPIYRVQILPPQQLEGSIAARQAAGWLSKATGWPVIDLTGR